MSAIVVGTLGAVLAVVGVRNPVTDALTLVFLAVVPAAAIAGLVPGSGPIATIAVAIAGAIAINGLVAEAMLALGAWSPRVGVLAVGTISALCVAAGRFQRGPRTAMTPDDEDHGAGYGRSPE